MPAYAQMPIDLTAAPNAAAAAAYGRVPLVYHQQPHQQQQQHHSMDAYHQAAAAGGSFQPVYQFPTGYATGGAAAGGAAGAGGAAMYAAAPDVYHQVRVYPTINTQATCACLCATLASFLSLIERTVVIVLTKAYLTIQLCIFYFVSRMLM